MIVTIVEFELGGSMNRTEILTALLDISEPLPSVVAALGQFSFDSEVELVVLKNTHVVEALRKFADGELDASDIEVWANAIESRDDIFYEPDSAVGEALQELANPFLTQPLTRLRASWWSARLGGCMA